MSCEKLYVLLRRCDLIDTKISRAQVDLISRAAMARRQHTSLDFRSFVDAIDQVSRHTHQSASYSRARQVAQVRHGTKAKQHERVNLQCNGVNLRFGPSLLAMVERSIVPKAQPNERQQERKTAYDPDTLAVRLSSEWSSS